MLKKLEEKIIRANQAYSVGKPYLTDTEYDVLWQQLFNLDPYNKVLYHTNNNTMFGATIKKHLRKIKGTRKAFNSEDLLGYLTRFKELILEPKYDGCAAVLYKLPKGEYSLILEGDGEKGRDVTHHLKNLILTFYPYSFNSVEIILPKTAWKDSYGSNPRNTIAGWLNRKDFPKSTGAEIISHSFGGISAFYHYDEDIDKFTTYLLNLYNLWKTKYPIDGIMIKPKSLQVRLIADTHPDVYQWSMAWKPPIQVKKTIVEDIEWNVSRKGYIIPTVIYSPIELCQTVNKRATGNNYKWIKNKQIYIGSEIEVGKAGEIIPKILSSNGEGISNIPTLCPICKKPLLKRDKHLYCDNILCLPQVIKSVAYFYSDKGMDLDSIGEAFIEKLCKDKSLYTILKQYPYALLIPDTFNIYDKISKIMGLKLTRTYKYNLMEINKVKDECHFIAALGFSSLAYKNAIKIYQTLKTNEVHSSIPKKAILNYKFAYNILCTFKGVQKNKEEFTLLKPPSSPILTYCITGKLTTSRNNMITYLNKYKWQYTNQISKKTSLLIVGEKPGMIKMHNAKVKNVVKITEEEIPYIIKKLKQVKGVQDASRRSD